jgi:choline dehydrogenase-like flavoprotein
LTLLDHATYDVAKLEKVMGDTIYDVIIIGGSYAGLSAALQLSRARRKVLIIDQGLRRNRFASHSHGVITQDGVDPAVIAAEARAQVMEYNTVEWVSGRADAVRRDMEVTSGAAPDPLFLRLVHLLRPKAQHRYRNSSASIWNKTRRLHNQDRCDEGHQRAWRLRPWDAARGVASVALAVGAGNLAGLGAHRSMMFGSNTHE